MKDLRFDSNFCKEYELYNAHSNPANKEQVSLDVARLGEKGKISFKKEGDFRSIFKAGDLAANPEIFFTELNAFPLPFQGFVNKHFHHGGELYSGIRYLKCQILGRIGCQSTDTTREFVFGQEGDQLIVEEIFRAKGLAFLPLNDLSSSFDFASQEEVLIELSKDERAMIEFLRQQLKETYARGDRFDCTLKQDEIGPPVIKVESMTDTIFAANYPDEPALMTFRVRHRLTLDKSAADGISRQPFTADDFSATVHDTLYPDNYTINFSGLFSPNLTTSRCPPPYSKKYSLIESSYKFILFISNVLLNYFKQATAGHSAAVTKELNKNAARGTSFSQRMRA